MKKLQDLTYIFLKSSLANFILKKVNDYVGVNFDCFPFVSEVDRLLARDPLVEVSILQSILSFVPHSNLIGLHLVVPKSYANLMAVIFKKEKSKFNYYFLIRKLILKRNILTFGSKLDKQGNGRPEWHKLSEIHGHIETQTLEF